MALIFVLSVIFVGIQKNDDGVPYDEENFEEAIKNVNALSETKVNTAEWLSRCVLFLCFNYLHKASLVLAKEFPSASDEDSMDGVSAAFVRFHHC